MPCGDLVTPADDGPAELTNLGRAGLVLEIGTEPVDELGGQIRVGDGVDRSHNLLGMPRGADLAVRVAGAEETQQLGAPLGVEPFVGLGQQPPTSVEGIVLAASMAQGLVLDPPADLVDPLVGQLHQMERVGDLDRVGQHGVERQPPRTRQVQHRPPNGVAPRLGPLVEPRTGTGGGAALDHIEQLAGSDIDDRGRPRLSPPAALPGEEHLIEPERGHRRRCGRGPRPAGCHRRSRCR